MERLVYLGGYTYAAGSVETIKEETTHYANTSSSQIQELLTGSQPFKTWWKKHPQIETIHTHVTSLIQNLQISLEASKRLFRENRRIEVIVTFSKTVEEDVLASSENFQLSPIDDPSYQILLHAQETSSFLATALSDAIKSAIYSPFYPLDLSLLHQLSYTLRTYPQFRIRITSTPSSQTEIVAQFPIQAQICNFQTPSTDLRTPIHSRFTAKLKEIKVHISKRCRNSDAFNNFWRISQGSIIQTQKQIESKIAELFFSQPQILNGEGPLTLELIFSETSPFSTATLINFDQEKTRWLVDTAHSDTPNTVHRDREFISTAQAVAIYAFYYAVAACHESYLPYFHKMLKENCLQITLRRNPLSPLSLSQLEVRISIV